MGKSFKDREAKVKGALPVKTRAIWASSSLKESVKVKVTQLCPTLCHPMPSRFLCPWDFPGKNTGAFPSPGDLPDPRIEPRSPALQTDSLPSELPGKLNEFWILNY